MSSKKEQIATLEARLKRTGHLLRPEEYKYCTELLKDLREDVKQMAEVGRSKLFAIMNSDQRARAQSWKGDGSV